MHKNIIVTAIKHVKVVSIIFFSIFAQNLFADSSWQSPEIQKLFLFPGADHGLNDPVLGALLLEDFQDEETKEAALYLRTNLILMLASNLKNTDLKNIRKQALVSQLTRLSKIIQKPFEMRLSALVKSIGSQRNFVILIKDSINKLVLVDIEVSKVDGVFNITSIQNIRANIVPNQSMAEQLYKQEVEGFIPYGN